MGQHQVEEEVIIMCSQLNSQLALMSCGAGVVSGSCPELWCPGHVPAAPHQQLSLAISREAAPSGAQTEGGRCSGPEMGNIWAGPTAASATLGGL